MQTLLLWPWGRCQTPYPPPPPPHLTPYLLIPQQPTLPLPPFLIWFTLTSAISAPLICILTSQYCCFPLSLSRFFFCISLLIYGAGIPNSFLSKKDHPSILHAPLCQQASTLLKCPSLNIITTFLVLFLPANMVESKRLVNQFSW